eukprot:UN33780
MNAKFSELDPEEVQKKIQALRSGIVKCQRAPCIRDNDDVKLIATKIEEKIEDLKPKLFLITSLAQDGMRERHWKVLSKQTGVELTSAENITLKMAVGQFGLLDHQNVIVKEGEKAAKEYQIEQALDQM